MKNVVARESPTKIQIVQNNLGNYEAVFFKIFEKMSGAF